MTTPTHSRPVRAVVYAFRRNAVMPLVVLGFIAASFAWEGRPIPFDSILGVLSVWGALAAGYLKATIDATKDPRHDP